MEPKSNFYVVILAAGYATRLKPLSNRIPKPLIDIDGTTLISRIISDFKDAGFKKFCIIVGYMKELIKKEVQKFTDLEILTIDQFKPAGMADAIALAVNHILEKEETISSFFITAADIIFSKEEILKIYNIYTHSDIVLSLMKSGDNEIAKGHGNVKISSESDLSKDLDFNYGLLITDIIEKPSIDKILSEYYSLPLYIVNHEIKNYLNDLGISERGEKEFQDVLKQALSNGMNIKGIRIIKPEVTIENVGAYHLSKLRDIIIMNKRFLKGINIYSLKGELQNLNGPVRIKSDSLIEDDIVLGPHVIINNNCKIGVSCELSNSIIYNDVTIGKLCKLDWCIIDENVHLPDNFQAKECFITLNKKKELEIINF
jgi:mannose-1-phosphate guanylyltransferase